MNNYAHYRISPPESRGLAVEKLLGIGGRCSVWRVRRTVPASSDHLWAMQAGEPPVRLALKVPLEQPRAVASLQSLRQELDAMLPLLHEYIVRPWGLADTSTGRGLLLQPYAGGSLSRLLATAGVLSPGEVVTVLTPIAQATAHLHSLGAAHGDITAANILLAPDGRPALSDLGDSQLLGMPALEATSETDIAGLASVTWLCLTGELPGEAAVRAPLGALRGDLSPNLMNLLEDSLSESSSWRPTAMEFAQELFAEAEPVPLDVAKYADDDVLVEVPTRLSVGHAAPTRLWSPLRRHTPKAAAALGGAAAFSALGWLVGAG